MIFFWDLSQASSLQKVVFLLIAGALTLLIAWVNKRWGTAAAANNQEIPSEAPKQFMTAEEAPEGEGGR